MITYNKETPVLLIASDSVETIRQIYDMLQRIEPLCLYIVYNATATEEQKVRQELIQSVFAKIGWECKVKTLRNKKRMEYDAAMLKAVRWFFCNETEGIVLDGLSLPFPAFFAFCSCLLEKYRHDERIGHISCRDFLSSNKKSKTNDSYCFSKLIHTSSGWASWQRVWKDIDAQLKTFPAFKKKKVIDEIPSHKPFQFNWFYLFRYEERWEIRYEYMNLINNRLSIVPNFRGLRVMPAMTNTSAGYELPEMNHPVFIYNPVSEELLLQEVKYHTPAITPNKPDGITFLSDKLLSLNKEAQMQMKIPRIIHQIYEDPAGPPANLLCIAESWKEKMPGWEYRFWNRQMMHDFLTSHCKEFLPFYNAYPYNVQRWDAIRYLILYHIGGLYVDFDYECFQALDMLLTGSTCCMGMEPTVNSRIYQKRLVVGNALMASAPKHPYMAAIINDMKTNFSVNYGKGNSLQIIESTGPFMVTRVYERFNKKKDVSLLPADLIAPLTMNEVLMLRTGQKHPDVMKKIENAFAIHYFMGSWSPQTVDIKAIKQ